MSGSGRSPQSVRQAASHLSILSTPPAWRLRSVSCFKTESTQIQITTQDPCFPPSPQASFRHFYHLLFTVVERPVSPVGSGAHPRKSQGPDPLYYPAPRTPPSFSSQLPRLCNPDQHGSKLSPTQPFCTLLRSTGRLLQRTGCLYRLPSSDSLLILPTPQCSSHRFTERGVCFTPAMR